MIHFSRYIKFYIALSLLVIIPGVYSLVRFGLKPSIDFTGGALLEYRFEKKTDTAVIDSVGKDKKIPVFSVQSAKDQSFLIRTAVISQDQASEFKKALEVKTEGKVDELRFETIGPTLGKELMQKTAVAIFFAIIAILLYIAWAFKNITYGFAAIVALIHDLLVLIGSFSLFGHFFGVEVDSLFVTAVLTTTSFSVHDTIVVFDRIREIRKQKYNLDFRQACDVAISETMVRSLNNSLTIVFMLLALILLGGVTVKWFTMALLIGTISGTYSSPFVATPALIWLHNLRNKK